MRNRANRIPVAIAVAIIVLSAVGFAWAAPFISTDGIGGLLGQPTSEGEMKVVVNESTSTNYEIVPGTSARLDARVAVDSNVPAYVFAGIVDTTAEADIDTVSHLVHYEIEDGWQPLTEPYTDDDGSTQERVYSYLDEDGNTVEVYYREFDPASAGSTEADFRVLKNDTISYDANLVEDDMPTGQKIISVKASVVQIEGFESALKAYLGEELRTFAPSMPNAERFLYRVGNGNNVNLSSLFEAVDEEKAIDSANLVITVEPYNPNEISGTRRRAASLRSPSNEAVAIVTKNADWTRSTISFKQTGVVKVTVEDGDSATSIFLEVVNGKNVTSYAELNANKSSDMVLLNDIEMTSGGKVALANVTLHGNGFTFDVSKGTTAGTGAESNNYLVSLSSATLENVKVVGAVYTSFGATTSASYNNPVIYATGTSTIANSYISNCAVPVRANKGTFTIANSTLAGGSYANLDLRGGHLILEDVTTVNQADANDTASNGSTVVGMGIVTYYENVPESTRIEIRGDLRQYNYISKSSVSSLKNTYTRNAFTRMFDYSEFVYDDGTDQWVNAGIVSLTTSVGEGNIVTGEFSNAGAYYGRSVSLSGATGYVYAPKATAPAIYPGYSRSEQYELNPTCTFDYTGKNYVPRTADSNRFCYRDGDVVRISFDEGDSFTWDPAILAVSKNGNSLEYTIALDGVDYTDRSITLDSTGLWTVEYSIIDPFNYRLNENGGLETFEKVRTVTVVLSSNAKRADAKDAEFTFGELGCKRMIVGNDQYIMPDVDATSSSVASVAVSGTTVYCPVVTGRIKESGTSLTTKTEHSGDYQACFPVFDGVISITDFEDGGTGNPVTIGSTTTEMPEGSKLLSDVSVFAYQASGTPSDTPQKLSDGGVYKLYFVSPAVSSARNEYTRDVLYSYTDNAGEIYKYYVRYTVPAQTKSSCIAAGTLISMADGSSKPVESIARGDSIMTYSFLEGRTSEKPVVAIEHDRENKAHVITVTLDSGQKLDIIASQSLFDMDSREYFTVDEQSCLSCIGRSIMTVADGSMTRGRIANATVEERSEDYYELITAHDYNFIANGIMTCEPFIFNNNTFEIDGDYRYDRVAMLHDIATYGLFEYDEFSDYLTRDEFDAFGGPFFKVAVGKDAIGYERIFEAFAIFENDYDQDGG